MTGPDRLQRGPVSANQRHRSDASVSVRTRKNRHAGRACRASPTVTAEKVVGLSRRRHGSRWSRAAAAPVRRHSLSRGRRNKVLRPQVRPVDVAPVTRRAVAIDVSTPRAGYPGGPRRSLDARCSSLWPITVRVIGRRALWSTGTARVVAARGKDGCLSRPAPHRVDARLLS
jgi:hypothetical protein